MSYVRGKDGINVELIKYVGEDILNVYMNL